ncbi:Ger(x)C family spore germination C-terminal domain-containing protein [Paenibacillus alginolyticus]|uniref:Ger(x)C family spore germination C-terminal domain-containing protein n=1 Tax=Paenibacillus alginolyticus TaxID=59839 RepID=UPI0004924470|nr:Ger(x)C family spore germination C-terminal domain-containing protein [Paenibacillus alginolyticus]MCY9665773.1 Ger(x)C family spore germination C-terminal domain-containing protein [Paenibacillus alginolyticus]
MNWLTSRRNQNSHESDKIKETNLTSVIKLGRLAVLKEGKMVGWLTKGEALGVTFMANKFNSVSITIPCVPSSEGSNRTTIQINLPLRLRTVA